MKLHPIVLCGGSGSRLWPLSRDEHPKQLLPLVGERSLLQDTVLRLDGLAGVAAPVVVSNARYRFLIAEQMREIGKLPCPLLLEPVGRNTAPALTLAALRILAADPEGMLLAMPADHAITDAPAFRAAVGEALAHADAGQRVTFGVVPDAPETENESTYIPVGVRHRLENPGLIPLEMIEAQSGSYLGEDDITRFEDMYRRMEPSVGG